MSKKTTGTKPIPHKLTRGQLCRLEAANEANHEAAKLIRSFDLLVSSPPSDELWRHYQQACAGLVELLKRKVLCCRCRVCGCTDEDRAHCVEKTGAPCHWVGADLCSACAGEPAE